MSYFTFGQLGGWSESTIRSQLAACRNHLKNNNFLAAKAGLDRCEQEIQLLHATNPAAASTLRSEMVAVNNEMAQATGSGRTQVEMGREPTLMEKIGIIRNIATAPPGTPGAMARAGMSVGANIAAEQATEAARKAAECATAPIKCWWDKTSTMTKIMTIGIPGIILLGAGLVILHPYVSLANKIVRK